MCEQQDLWPETLQTPVKRAEEKIDTYMSMWRAERRIATLTYLRHAIDERIALGWEQV